MIKAFVKDYEVTLDDGKKEMVSGDVYIGVWQEDGSFYGAWFTDENGRIQFAGEVHLTKKEFDEQIESWSEI